MEKLIYDLWLDSLWECEPQKKHMLIQKYGDSFGVWKHGRSDIIEDKKGRTKEDSSIRTLEDAEKLRRELAEKKIWTVAWDDPQFPPLLKGIPNPPWMIYGLGDQNLLTYPCVSVVGARKYSEYGKLTARRIGMRLAQSGAVTVSGMASGIDSWAHEGALEIGRDAASAGGAFGRGGVGGALTIAVLGGGVDVCYPKHNRKLYGELIRRGAVISEFQPGVQPRRYYFPMRNRIISGLSQATVIVEAAIGSGSLITAELAAEQGREVFAVPGNIDRISSVGTNKLIKDGAGILISVEDLIHELGLEVQREEEQDEVLGVDEKKIVKVLLQHGEVNSDLLVRETGLPPGKINGLVTILEMKGILSTAIGKIFLAKKFENLYNMPL